MLRPAEHLQHVERSRRPGVGVLERSVGVDDEVGARGLLLGRHCAARRCRASASLSPRSTSRCELHRRRTGRDDHAVEVASRAGFVQQRDVDDGERRVAEQLEGAQPGGDRAVDRRVDDRFEVAARRRVGEHDRAELRAIDGAVGGEHVGAEPRGDRRASPRCRPPSRRARARRHRGTARRAGGTARARGSCPSRCRRSARLFSMRRDLGAEPLARYDLHCPSCLPAATRPSCPRARAARSVFFSSIAIVSGPTPPGTGDSAPATSATSGMHVADDERAAALERLAPLRAGARTAARRSRDRSTGVVPTSIDRRARLDEVRA